MDLRRTEFRVALVVGALLAFATVQLAGATPAGAADAGARGWGITADLMIDGRRAKRFLFTYLDRASCLDYAELVRRRYGMPAPPECRPLDTIPAPGEKES